MPLAHPTDPQPPSLAAGPRLRRLALGVQALTALGMAAVCVVPVLFWLSPDWVRQAAPDIARLGDAPITLDARALTLGALASLPAVAVALWLLGRLWQLFAEYRAGRVFSATAVLALRGFARAWLAQALVAPLQRTLLGLALTWGNPPGQRMLVLGIGWPDYMALLTGAALLAITSVMAQAVAQADENAGFV
jgi:hypothetical protein